jgi:serine/threonine protein kinase
LRILDDRYAIDLGSKRSGGMAEVFKARDMKDNRDVAIKYYGLDPSNNRETIEAFSRESRNLQALDHPNIVKVLDGGHDKEDGRRYIVLEWLDTDLLSHLERNPLNGWDDFYSIVGRPILGALTYAFSKDIVHRDLKPHNVLLTPSGVLQLTDFGISKYKRAVQPGLTLRSFRSPPYTPPEEDDRYPDTRDVFSFPVLAMRCLALGDLKNYDDVYRLFESLDAPSEALQVLRSCLERDPALRPENVARLYDLLERIQTKRELAWTPSAVCYVRVIAKALEPIRREYPDLDASAQTRLLVDDLNESVAFRSESEAERKQRSGPLSDSVRLQLIGGRYRYIAVVEKDHLVLIAASRPPSAFLDSLRSDAWQPAIEFRSGGPPGAVDARGIIATLLGELAEHEEREQQRRNEEKGDRIFKTWGQLLTAKEAVERSERRSIPYASARMDGARIHFKVGGSADEQLIGQPWFVQLAGGLTVSGEVDSVGHGFLVLWMERPPSVDIPARGELLFDSRASQRSLQKQRAALDAIRFERCVRPALKALLADPSKAAPPVEFAIPSFFQNELDDDKKRIAKKALGTQDFLFVEGPPGTGKTRLITEVVLQLLRRDPSCRILLSSQTHVALDNALERILEKSPSSKLVRIGQRQDVRIAESVRRLLLQNQVEEWLVDVRRRSASYIASWAKKHGVKHSDVELGMAVGRFRAAHAEEQRLGLKLVESEQELAQVREVLQGQESSREATTFQELEEKVQQLEETSQALKHERAGADARVTQAKKALIQSGDLGRDLARHHPDELAEWEEGLLNSDPATRKCRELIDLAEEWTLRFGKSSDFFGALLAEAQVVAGTCVGFMGARGITEIAFDVCIIDEASKANVPELLVPLSRARTWLVLGDRKQLPPFVDDALGSAALLNEYEISEDDVRRTLLDHLGEQLPVECYDMLRQQHRMCASIGNLVSECFYDGQLVSVRACQDNAFSLALPKPVTWFSTAGLPNHEELVVDQSFKNLAEVQATLKLLGRLNLDAKARKKRYTVVLLTGYGAQRLEFERGLAPMRAELEHLDIALNTVDAYQGREAEVAIYSVTRSNERGRIGFLRESERLNVALSRAQNGLAIVGDHVFCRSITGRNPFERVLHYIMTHPADCSLEELRP